MKWIRYEPGSKTKRLRKVNRLLAKINSEWELMDKEWIRSEGAATALGKLGPKAEECIGELSRLVDDPQAFYGGRHAVEALAALGEAGLPHLLSKLTNGPVDLRVRQFVASRVGLMGTNARTAIAAMQTLLSDPDHNMRNSAILALRRIDAHEAVSGLLHSLQHSDPSVRQQATNALRAIDPQALNEARASIEEPVQKVH